MAKLQKQFEKFHKDIKVKFDELIEKRDIILNKIKKSLKEKNRPSLDLINQGSYIYGVGVKPISDDQEYDIDVGLAFNINSDEYKATDVRNWVYDAIKDHTEDVEEKGPCIRVRYQAGYHVDLICYANNDSKESENFKLAHKDGSWKDTDPKGLKNYIKEKRKPFSNSKDGSGSDQLQRVVRYLKRWNDKALPEESNDKPVGLALLLFCIENLTEPVFEDNEQLDDLNALKIISSFAGSQLKISVNKPTPEYEDIFGKISNTGMSELIVRFSNLDEALQKAKDEESLEVACKILRDQFGDNFPLDKNKPEDTYKKTQSPAIITSSSSA